MELVAVVAVVVVVVFRKAVAVARARAALAELHEMAKVVVVDKLAIGATELAVVVAVAAAAQTNSLLDDSLEAQMGRCIWLAEGVGLEAEACIASRHFELSAGDATNRFFAQLHLRLFVLSLFLSAQGVSLNSSSALFAFKYFLVN